MMAGVEACRDWPEGFLAAVGIADEVEGAGGKDGDGGGAGVGGAE